MNDDLISRQAVLDILEREGHKWGNDYRDWVDAVNEVETLPSVNPQEPKTGWIPVSERLPKVADCYAVTRKIGSDLIVDACFFDGKNTWHHDNRTNHERNYLTNIIAWMPLPEPYKAESEDKE